MKELNQNLPKERVLYKPQYFTAQYCQITQNKFRGLSPCMAVVLSIALIPCFCQKTKRPPMCSEQPEDRVILHSFSHFSPIKLTRVKVLLSMLLKTCYCCIVVIYVFRLAWPNRTNTTINSDYSLHCLYSPNISTVNQLILKNTSVKVL